MKNIEMLQKDYVEDINKEYLYWKSMYEEDSSNSLYLDMVNIAIDTINNFDEAYANMIEQETRGFLHTILSRIRKYKDPFEERKNGIVSYTRLGFREDDVLVISFVNYAKYVRGYVAEDKLSKFISAVKRELISVNGNSKNIDNMLEESKIRMQPIDKKVKEKKAK